MVAEEEQLVSSPRHEGFDVVVAGSGLGGLSAAAALARAGKRVLVAERLPGAGGFAHAFRRGPYLIDPAIHAIGQGTFLDGLLGYLGVADRCTLLPIDSLYTAVFPGMTFHAPLGMEAFVAAHLVHFPRERDGLRSLLNLCNRVVQETQQQPLGSAAETVEQKRDRFNALWTYRNATVAEVLDQHLSSSRLKALCTVLWGYQGLPPSRLGFLSWARMTASLIQTGRRFPQGSFQRLVDAFVASLEMHGGQLLLGNGVLRVLVEDGRVYGVKLQRGQVVRAPVVISNADARRTFKNMVGADHLPRPFLKRFRSMAPSLSAFVLYTATRADPGPCGLDHETFMSPSWDHDEVYRDILAGRGRAMLVTIPTLIDPSLAPPGQHLVTCFTLAPFEVGVPWRELKKRYVETLLGDVETVFPGFRDGLIFAEGSTPSALQRHSLNLRGAIYGWENSPEQTGFNRPSPETPISGLYLVGNWTQPGSGSINVIHSGLQVAQRITGNSAVRSLVPAGRSPDC